MNYDILLSDQFKKEFKRLAGKYISLNVDLDQFITSLEQEPIQGIPLGNDCYKIRMAIKSKGRGKSGGARVITCVKITKEIIYLISIYDKSDKEDISAKELSSILKQEGLL